jgi:hypothetical protein
MPLITRATTETRPEPVESNRPPAPILINDPLPERDQTARSSDREPVVRFAELVLTQNS